MRIDELVKRVLVEAGKEFPPAISARLAMVDVQKLIRRVRPDRHLGDSPAADAMMKVSLELPTIAQELEARIAIAAGGRVPFALWVFTDGRMSYISSVDRDHVAAMMRHVLAGWEAGMPDVPAHQVAG